MTMTMTPAPVTAVLNSAPAQWWELLGTLGPLAILLGAVVAATIGGFTLKQRTKADDRSEWWGRAQWALDRALDDHPSTKALGLATLEVLAGSTLAHAEELELFDAAWATVNDLESSEAMERGITEGGSAMGTDESVSKGGYAPRSARKVRGQGMAPQERRVKIAAAKLRVTLDGRLGRVTPEEVKSLAKEPF